MMVVLLHIVDNVFMTHLAISVHTDQNVSMVPRLHACVKCPDRNTLAMLTLSNQYNEPSAPKLAQTKGRMRPLKQFQHTSCSTTALHKDTMHQYA